MLDSERPAIPRRDGRVAEGARLESEYRGEMAEWLKAHAWKACIPQGIQGSNPCLSATDL